MDSDSYVRIPAFVARNMASKTMAQIAAYRQREWQEEIADLQRRRNAARAWFPWLRPMSYEDARHKIEERRGFTPDLSAFQNRD